MTDERVSLVIPGRNCADTVGACLEAVVPLLSSRESPLAEILFVDDGSTDQTATVVQRYPVRLITTSKRGAGAARNLGWRNAESPLVWFMDSDCVAEPDALARLMPHMADPAVGGVSGSYGNMRPDSLLACLIHEEIVERHRRMGARVDFLATFNVLYRREAIDRVGGFDERYLKGQDAELSFRVQAAGYELHFELNSRVKHFHESRWLKYLSTQRQQGYWRVFLHLAYPQHSTGDSYSTIVDHIQPPLALLSLTALPAALIPSVRWLSVIPSALLLLAQVLMTVRLTARCKSARYLAYLWMGFIRAYWRGIGMVQGILKRAFGGGRR
jgi:cellulose synthase/poly-beta-1,6-N-acetylglucosamine synthase-like glycosyltransferase